MCGVYNIAFQEGVILNEHVDFARSTGHIPNIRFKESPGTTHSRTVGHRHLTLLAVLAGKRISYVFQSLFQHRHR